MVIFNSSNRKLIQLSRTVLSNIIATIHMLLFKFTKLKFNSSVAIAKFLFITRRLLVSGHYIGQCTSIITEIHIGL